jgi:hypothetical protein
MLGGGLLIGNVNRVHVSKLVKRVLTSSDAGLGGLL